MEALLIGNAVIFALLFMAWRKNDFLNFTIKSILLAAFILNGIQAYKVSEQNRLERKEKNEKSNP